MHHPSALNNRGPILEKLQAILQGKQQHGLKVTRAIEVASGTGAHLEVFAPAFPEVTWQPTEYVPPKELVSPEEAFNRYGRIGQGDRPVLNILNDNLKPYHNVEQAQSLDLTDPGSFSNFVGGDYQLVHAGNLLHICPASATDGFFRFSAHVLSPTSIVTVYGPFKRHGKFTTESNADFDKTLRGKNEDFGLRDLESELVPAAQNHGFTLEQIIDMPSNNFLLVFSKL